MPIVISQSPYASPVDCLMSCLDLPVITLPTVGCAKANNQHLSRVRRKAREAIALRRLCGIHWVRRWELGGAGRMEEELGIGPGAHGVDIC